MAKNDHGTATEIRPTQIGEVIKIFITALTTIIGEFKISDVINALKDKGDKLSYCLRLVIRAFMEEGEIKLFVKNYFPGNEYLKLVSEDEKIIIPACPGGYVITEDTDTFNFLSAGFKDGDVNEPSKPTLPTTIGIYKVQKNGTSGEIFNSIVENTEIIELTLEQLRAFVLENKKMVSKHLRILSVYKNTKNRFFVVHMYLTEGGGLGADIFPLESVPGPIWFSENVFYVVLPQLELEAL